jgi:AraC family transcriptional regulator
VSERPIAFAGDGFEIVVHESAPVGYPEESHATVQICIPMFGARYKVKRESETGAALEQDLGARDILLVPAGQPHAVQWLRRAGIVSLQISERFVEETLDVPRLTLPDFLAVRDRFVTVAAAELYASMGAEETIAPVFAEALVVGVAHRIATTASRSNFRKSVAVRRLTPVLLRRIERYIDENLERQVGLCELATLAGLSRWYFLRVFAETVGTSPHDYVTRRRLDRARNLLCSTNRSVMDIAGEVGMTHSHFTRVFSRRLGVTPTEFRRINRQKARPPTATSAYSHHNS